MNPAAMSGRCDKTCDADGPESSRTLGIIHEFRRLYEEKMRIIEAEGGGDCNLEAKLSLQNDWIRDLNEQNEMLVRAVEELEQEATERVIALEDKLRHSSKCACEVMNSYKDLNYAFQHVDALQEDVCTLLEFIKQSAIQRTWNLSSLSLRTVRLTDTTEDVDETCHGAHHNEDTRNAKMQQEIAMKEKCIQMLQQQLDDAIHCKQMMALEIEKECSKCEEMRKSMLDIRDALTAEVAEKHDVILTLKKDVHVLEEQCKKADQQTHFKDDIIKELRKEIKQLKSERCDCTCANATRAALRTPHRTCDAGRSDVLIDKLHSVCDNIERKLRLDRWPCLPPMKRAMPTCTTYLRECQPTLNASRFAPCATPPRMRGCEISCQTEDICSPIPVQPPCGLPLPAMLTPPPTPGICVFDRPVLDRPTICEAGCQTLRFECRSVPTQCSRRSVIQNRKSFACQFQPPEVEQPPKTNFDKKTSFKSINPEISPSESSSSSVSDSALTIDELLLPEATRERKQQFERSECSNDCLRLASLNLESPGFRRVPRTGIYRDSRFHNVIQVQEKRKPPMMFSASLINLNEILNRRPGHCIVAKVPKKGGKGNQLCDCNDPHSRPITLDNMRRISRNADYLAVKAAIDVSQQHRLCDSSEENVPYCRLSRGKTAKKPPCDCTSQECFVPRQTRRRRRETYGDYSRRYRERYRVDDDSYTDLNALQLGLRRDSMMRLTRYTCREGRSPHEDSLGLYLYPDRVESCNRRTCDSDDDDDYDSEEEEEEELGEYELNRYDKDVEAGIRSQILGDIVRHVASRTSHMSRASHASRASRASRMSRMSRRSRASRFGRASRPSRASRCSLRSRRSATSMDSLRRSQSRPLGRRSRRSRRRSARAQELAIRTSKFDTSELEMYHVSVSDNNPFQHKPEEQHPAPVKQALAEPKEVTKLQELERSSKSQKPLICSGRMKLQPSNNTITASIDCATFDGERAQGMTSRNPYENTSKSSSTKTRSGEISNDPSTTHSTKKKVMFNFNERELEQEPPQPQPLPKTTVLKGFAPQGNHYNSPPLRPLPSLPPRIKPTTPPIPRVSCMIQQDGSLGRHSIDAEVPPSTPITSGMTSPRRICGMVGARDTNVEYIQGLFDFLRKTKQHAESGIDLMGDTSSQATTTSKQSTNRNQLNCPKNALSATRLRAENANARENSINTNSEREKIVKKIDWTEIAKLFPQ